MRREWLAIPILVGFIVSSIALTQVHVAYGTDVNPSDGIVRGIWRIVDSPFHVKRDIVVPADESLTIEPGVIVYFDGYYSLTVQGRLVASGTHGNRITFSWKDGGTDRNRWLGIYLYSATRASTITYCYIMNAKKAISVYGSFNNILTFNTIRYNSAGILISAAEGNTITDNEIYENTESAICLRQGSLRNEISRNTIYNIGPLAAPYNRGDGIVFNSSLGGPMNKDNKIKDNTIYNCHFSAIKLDHVENLEISGNLLYANFQRGPSWNGTGGNIYLRKSNDTTLDYENKDIVINNNRLHSAAGNGSGIFIQSARNIRITYNDIYLNTFAGIVVGSKLGNVTVLCQINRNDIRNNRIYQAWDNGTTMAWDDGSRGNYWSDYTGIDRNNDGIGDAPHVLNGTKGSKDNFPLMSPTLFIAKTYTSSTTLTSTRISTSFILTTTGVETTRTTVTSTLRVTSPSYIWTVSTGTTSVMHDTSTTSTSTTVTAVTTSTSLTTTSVTSYTTTTATTTLVQTVTPRRCFIASAAYGSELVLEVQQLRKFRDTAVLSSLSGASFMRLFDRFYYSFSPSIANRVSSSPALAEMTRATLYPLIEILRFTSVIGAVSELGVIAAGLMASALIGAVYGTPIMAVSYLLGRLGQRRLLSSRRNQHVRPVEVLTNGRYRCPKLRNRSLVEKAVARALLWLQLAHRQCEREAPR